MEGGVYISSDIVLSVLKYFVYLIILMLSTFMIYRGLSTQQERKNHRTKLQKQIILRRNNFIKKTTESELEGKLKAAYNPFGLNAARYEIGRAVILVLLIIYYWIFPLLNGEFQKIYILIPTLFFFVTITNYKYAPGYLLLEYAINYVNKKKITELFSLFDTIKVKLKSLNDNQQVNVYNILKESAPTFHYINVPINKFLSLWKSDPDKAKQVFKDSIGDESSDVLGDVLYRLDKTTKEEALNTIRAESEIFSTRFYESYMQRADKRKHILFAFYAFTSAMILLWIIFLMMTIVNVSIDANSL